MPDRRGPAAPCSGDTAPAARPRRGSSAGRADRCRRSWSRSSGSDRLVTQVDGPPYLQLETGQLAGGSPLHLEAEPFVGLGESLAEALGHVGPSLIDDA